MSTEDERLAKLEHCEGEPTVSPWRLSAHGTAYAVVVCACGQTMWYAEIEISKGEAA